MSHLISSFSTQDTIFHIEIDEQDHRISPRKDQIKPQNTSGPLFERVRKNIEENQKVFHQMTNDPFTLVKKEVKEKNGWGNSFDKELEVIFKTHEITRSHEISIVPQGKVSKENKENLYPRDIFDESSSSEEKWSSNTPRSYYAYTI